MEFAREFHQRHKISNQSKLRFASSQSRMRAMKQFLRRHRFDIALAIICVVDVFAISKFPALCELATGAMIIGMVMDHKKQESKMGQENTEGH
jgi:hypothetical protein